MDVAPITNGAIKAAWTGQLGSAIDHQYDANK